MSRQETINAITKALREKPGIQALFLSGSYGTGLEDAFSDIDFTLVAEPGASDAIAATWRDAVAQTGNIVLWWDRNLRPALINAITVDWTRIDVVILKPDQLGGLRQDAVKVLFDPHRLYDRLAAETRPTRPTSAHLRYQIEEFIRILGLLPLAVGREEYLNGVLGVFHLRNLLVDLMIAEAAPQHRGGTLHLNRLLAPAQREILARMPPPLPEKDAMIAGHLAYAQVYLPLARKCARAWGVDWPARFEEVTWHNLNATLGIKQPYTPD